MAQLHSLLLANHRPYADVYADATERLAATGFVRALGGGVVPFTVDDLYKKVLQLDNASEWVLTAITPTWVQVSGGDLLGDVVGPSASVASEFMLFDGTTGKLAKRATGSGFVKATSGVYSTQANPVTGLPFDMVVACSDLSTALAATEAQMTFPWSRAVTLSSVHAFLVTPQTSGSIFTVDVKEAGATIFSTKITIDNAETDSTSAATAPVISDPNIAAMAKITVDIDQIGDGTAKGLYLVFLGVYA